ncbi:MAG: hypothetical protein JW888_06660, partial [Pirellulales bacterium]|nr:hypothetical protein [Pirellulales bacterium]
DFLLYSVSLPERTFRVVSGLVGGALRESASLLVPQAFQTSKTYSVMVRQMLDFLAEDVGGVARSDDPDAPPPVENFVARKAVGNFVELAGLATLHLSPLMVLAIFSDVAYGSKTYLKELAVELKKEGVIDENSTIDRVDELLDALAQTSRTTATAFDTPPMSIDGLRETIRQTREAAATVDPASVLPQDELQRLWDDLHNLAEREGVNPFAISSAVTLYSLNKIGSAGRGALSSVRVAGSLFDRHVIDHYAKALGKIRAEGFYTTLAKTSKPYAEAVWRNFSSEKSTVTEDLLSGKLVGRAYSTARRWLGGK